MKDAYILLEDGFRVKIQIFPPVFVLDCCHGLLSHSIVADQRDSVLKAALSSQAVRAVFRAVSNELCPAFFAGWLPDKMKFCHTARTDQCALRQYDLPADRTAAWKQQIYNSDFITSWIRIFSPV